VIRAWPVGASRLHRPRWEVTSRDVGGLLGHGVPKSWHGRMWQRGAPVMRTHPRRRSAGASDTVGGLGRCGGDGRPMPSKASITMLRGKREWGQGFRYLRPPRDPLGTGRMSLRDGNKGRARLGPADSSERKGEFFRDKPLLAHASNLSSAESISSRRSIKSGQFAPLTRSWP
jgi:hypothetical protein